MKTSGFHKSFLKEARISSILLLICASFLLIQTQVWKVSFSEGRHSKFVSPPLHSERLSFGFNEVLADSMWIRLLQDFDYCEQSISKNICKNESWLFQMLDTVTNLSPKFRVAYSAGGLALTILISDFDGATKIFNKGVKAFPHDWPILYRAAYHYLYEVKDKKRAAELLIQAGQNGAPPWVFTLAGRLYSDSGELDLAQNLLQEMKNTDQDATLIQRLQDKIDSMKAAKGFSSNRK